MMDNFSRETAFTRVTSSRFLSRVDEMLLALRSNVLTTGRLWHKGVARMEIEIAV